MSKKPGPQVLLFLIQNSKKMAGNLESGLLVGNTIRSAPIIITKYPAQPFRQKINFESYKLVVCLYYMYSTIVF